MSDDSELERLNAKRLAEMQRNLSRQQEPAAESAAPQKASSRDIVAGSLGYRGLEVLTNAESQFPNHVPHVIQKLADLISSGELAEQLDGGRLLALFRAIGINVRMETKIHVEKDGKLVSLSDKIISKDD